MISLPQKTSLPSDTPELDAAIHPQIVPDTLNTAARREKLDSTPRPAKLWMPQRVIFTPAALLEDYGQTLYKRLQKMELPIEELSANRLTGLRGADEKATYMTAKRTLAIVTAPPSAFKLRPIPPSADFQFHLAEGCPAHCQYCYLAGSLSGPPVVRVFANLPQILDNLSAYEKPSATSFEVSCYTDPLGIEHLTGSLAGCIRYFGTRENAHLRCVSKFDDVDELLTLPHNKRTRMRASVNAAPVSNRFESGTANVAARLQALRKLAQHDYPVGLVIAPIMMMDDWQAHYSELLDLAAQALDCPCNLTFELITHRFTPLSKDVLLSWYPKTQLDMNEESRAVKRNKFGGTKYVYPRETMKTLRAWFEREIANRFPQGRILYWT